MRHNYWSPSALEPAWHNWGVHVPQQKTLHDAVKSLRAATEPWRGQMTDWINKRTTLKAESTSGLGWRAGAPLVCAVNRYRAPESQLEWQETQQFLLVVLPAFSSVQSLSRVWLFATPWTPACQVFLSITNSLRFLKLIPLSQWCHPTITSSVVPFSSCFQPFPASRVTSGSQTIGVSALASFLPKDTQDWSPLEWRGWISLQSKGLSRVFSNTVVQKHQYFST